MFWKILNTEKLKTENHRETINMDRFYKSTDNDVDYFKEAVVQKIRKNQQITG